MNPIISLVGIFLGLILLIVLAYKGHSIIWVAPLCAVLVAVLGGLMLYFVFQNHATGLSKTLVSEGPTIPLTEEERADEVADDEDIEELAALDGAAEADVDAANLEKENNHGENS